MRCRRVSEFVLSLNDHLRDISSPLSTHRVGRLNYLFLNRDYTYCLHAEPVLRLYSVTTQTLSARLHGAISQKLRPYGESI